MTERKRKKIPPAFLVLRMTRKRSEGGKRIFFRLYPEILTHRYRVLEKMKDIVKTDRSLFPYVVFSPRTIENLKCCLFSGKSSFIHQWFPGVFLLTQIDCEYVGICL